MRILEDTGWVDGVQGPDRVVVVDLGETETWEAVHELSFPFLDSVTASVSGPRQRTRIEIRGTLVLPVPAPKPSKKKWWQNLVWWRR